MVSIPAAWTTLPLPGPPLGREQPGENDPPTMELPESLGWEKYKKEFKKSPIRGGESYNAWHARNQADHAAYERGRVKHNPSKQLLYAIQRGERDTALFDDLVARGATIWDRDSATSDSALHLAAIAENPVAVKWLLEKGLPWWVSAVDEKNKYAIGRAIKGGECWKVLMNWMVESDYARYYRPFEGRPNTVEWHFHPMDVEIDNSSYLNERCQYVYRVDQGSMEVSLITSKSQSAVMAGWETPIMKESARLLMDGQGPGKSILNIGFGLGIIDTEFQYYSPSNHTIIEAHPDALTYFENIQFDKSPFSPGHPETSKCEHIDNPKKTNIKLIPHPWKEVFEDPKLRAKYSLGTFDAIYFDTFQEGYRAFLEFFKYVPGLMKGPGSRMSFFQGHGAFDDCLHEAYRDILTLHLNDLGMRTIWSDLKVKRTRWTTETYTTGREIPLSETPQQMPICIPAPTVPRKVVARSNFFDGSRIPPTATTQDKAASKKK